MDNMHESSKRRNMEGPVLSMTPHGQDKNATTPWDEASSDSLRRAPSSRRGRRSIIPKKYRTRPIFKEPGSKPRTSSSSASRHEDSPIRSLSVPIVKDIQEELERLKVTENQHNCLEQPSYRTTSRARVILRRNTEEMFQDRSLLSRTATPRPGVKSAPQYHEPVELARDHSDLSYFLRNVGEKVGVRRPKKSKKSEREARSVDEILEELGDECEIFSSRREI